MITGWKPVVMNARLPANMWATAFSGCRVAPRAWPKPIRAPAVAAPGNDAEADAVSQSICSHP